MLVELVPDMVLAVLYLLACLAAFIIRGKLSGSLVAKRFTTMGVGWLLGLLLIGARLAIEHYQPLKLHTPGVAYRAIGLLAIHLPVLLVALSLISLAALYSRYT